MSQGPAIQKTIVQGVVSDTSPESAVDGSVQELSLTADGRLRVRTDGYDESLTWFKPETRNMLVEFPFESVTFNHSAWE